MFFWLKKLLGYWVNPVPVFVLLLVLVAILLRTKRGARAGRILATIAAVSFALLANKLVSIALVRPLETRYPAIPELNAASLPAEVAKCQYVVVLGSGNGDTPGLSAFDELSVSGRARITEAVRILHALPKAQLIVSGPAFESPISHATVLERTAVSLGVDPARIQRIEHARDTEDESLAVKRRAGDAPVMVVTSAWHMPRAMALFRAAGVQAVACPTDYASQWDGRFHWRDLLWDVESLERSTVAIRERIGYVWISLRGKGG